jgi:predicted RNA-binding protein with TRAM domain
MPDESGKLTPDEKTKVVAWLTSFGRPAPACPICGSENWQISDHLVQPVTLGPKVTLLLSGIGYPQVGIVSVPCGYTMFVNAVMAGVLPGAAVPPSAKT